jgi:hypothetical protein
MNQNVPIIKVGSKINVNPIIKESVIKRMPKRCINENNTVGINKYNANFGKKNLNPTKSWSKILPNLLCTMLSKKFLMLVSFHQTI